MALPKLYEQITWVNDTTPALNEDNLNAMSQALDDIDDRVIDLAGTIMEDVPQIQEDMAILGPAVENIDSNVARAEAAAESAEQYAEEISPPIEVVKDFAPIITIEDAINKPVKDLKIKIEAVQSGSGTPSPDNVRPITGHSEAKITRAGKNLCPRFPNFSSNNISFTTASDGKVTVTNNGSAASGLTALVMSVDLTFPCDMILSGSPSGGSDSTYRFDYNNGQGRDYGNGVTIPANTTIENFRIRIASGYMPQDLVFEPMLRPATITDGTYEPYQGEVFTIDLGSTRYGGVLDVDAGTLTLTHGYIELNGGTDENWDYSSSDSQFVLDQRNSTKKLLNKAGSVPQCNQYRGVSTVDGGWGNLGNGDVGFHPTLSEMARFETTAYTSLQAWKTAIASSNIQLVYELATPQTITLTAEEVTLLWAYNTLFADTGDISLTYDASGVLRIANGKLDIDTFKAVVAASSDFADFKSRVAAL